MRDSLGHELFWCRRVTSLLMHVSKDLFILNVKMYKIKFVCVIIVSK